MTSVKGSKQYRMVVVPYRPAYRFVMWLLGGAIIAAAVSGSYFVGSYKGKEQQRQAIAERDQLRIAVAEKTKEADDLRQSVANLKLGAKVDRKASEDVRNEVLSLKAKIAELQEDITFYRGLMAPTANKQGLAIGSLNVISTGVPRHYEYKVVIQQLATNHQVLNGFLTFNIIGRVGSEIKTLSLKDISTQVEQENIKLRFKYFQNLEGELILPEAFEPERIELLAKSIGRHAATVEKKFGWLVQES